MSTPSVKHYLDNQIDIYSFISDGRRLDQSREWYCRSTLEVLINFSLSNIEPFELVELLWGEKKIEKNGLWCFLTQN